MAKTDIVRNEPATSAEQQADVAQKERTPLKFNKVTGKTTAVPADVADRMRNALAEQHRAEQEKHNAEITALQRRFAAQRALIVPRELDEKLRAHAAAKRLPEDASVEDRRRRFAAQTRYATEIGVDTAALTRWREDFGREAQRLAVPPHLSSENTVVDSTGEALKPSGLVFNGSWDPGYSAWSSHSSQFAIWNAQSYFDPANARAGSNIKFRQRETDDSDNAGMQWPNGYMVLYTMPRTGRLQIRVDMTCDFSRHFIDCDNEPGNSSCKVQAFQAVYASIYNDWSDEVPVMNTSGIVLEDDYSTDEEEWIDWSPIPAGASRTVYLHSATTPSLPVGFDFAIWVAQLNYAEAIKLNDTRATIGVNASWVINNITVTTF